MADRVVHFEISTSDPEALGRFYSQLFGWNVQYVPEPPYVLVDTAAGTGINGGIGKAIDEQSVKFYIAVNDLGAALERIEKLGGKTVMEPTVLPMVTFAQFSDPDGNVLGLVLDDGGQGDAQGPTPGNNPPVAWFEVMGKDSAKLQRFYAAAFGWNIKSSKVDGIDYGQVDAPEGGIAGGVSADQEGKLAITMYAGVDDLTKYLDKAESLGAKTVVPPIEVDQTTSIALFADPQGNVFGIFKSTS